MSVLARVAIVQRRLADYRVPLFTRLRALLHEQQVELRLYVGDTGGFRGRGDGGQLDWAQAAPAFDLAGGRLCWQPLWQHLRSLDLIVLPHENKLLFNHLLLALPRHCAVALWGHGRHPTRRPTAFAERMRRVSARAADWWFAYTQISVDAVANAGFPRERITLLNNTVDTSALRVALQAVNAAARQQLRDELGLRQARVAVFIGSLYPDKRVDFLLRSCLQVRQRVDNFHLLVIGDGECAPMVGAWAQSHGWVHWLGARRGTDKAAYASLGELLLNPSAIGLVAIDSFTLGLPIVATRDGAHGPELAYLQHDINALLTGDSERDYADAVVALLRDAERLQRLKRGCAQAADSYSIDDMAARFRDGILQSLALRAQPQIEEERTR